MTETSPAEPEQVPARKRRRQTRYLDRVSFAERIGVKPATLNRYRMPAPDAILGEKRGWLPKTVDAWNARRPGRGATTEDDWSEIPGQRPATEYLTRPGVAEFLGVHRGTLNRYHLPTPDALVGDLPGWLPETIAVWDANRPSRVAERERAARNKRRAAALAARQAEGTSTDEADA